MIFYCNVFQKNEKLKKTNFKINKVLKAQLIAPCWAISEPEAKRKNQEERN